MKKYSQMRGKMTKHPTHAEIRRKLASKTYWEMMDEEEKQGEQDRQKFAAFALSSAFAAALVFYIGSLIWS